MNRLIPYLAAAALACAPGALTAATFDGLLEASLQPTVGPFGGLLTPKIAECRKTFQDHNSAPVQEIGQAVISNATLAPGTYAFSLTMSARQGSLLGAVVPGWYHLKTKADIQLHGTPAASTAPANIGPILSGQQMLHMFTQLNPTHPNFPDGCDLDPLICMLAGPLGWRVESRAIPDYNLTTYYDYWAWAQNYGIGTPGILPFKTDIRHVSPASPFGLLGN